MSVYAPGTRRGQLDAIRARQATAAAVALQAEAELAAIQTAERDLARVQRRRDKAIAALLTVRDKFKAEAEASAADLELMRQVRLEVAANAKKAAAAASKLERELTRAEESELDLRRLQRERARTTDRLREKNTAALATIHQIIRQQVELPPPVHGGREGLEAATREAAGHDASKHSQRRTA